MPPARQTASSPAPTSRADIANNAKVASPSIIRKVISAPTISALKITGISRESRGMPLNVTFLNALADIAASKVAAEPKRISHIPIGLERLPIMHPIVSPGIAAGVKTERIVSASESLN